MRSLPFDGSAISDTALFESSEQQTRQADASYRQYDEMDGPIPEHGHAEQSDGHGHEHLKHGLLRCCKGRVSRPEPDCP